MEAECRKQESEPAQAIVCRDRNFSSGPLLTWPGVLFWHLAKAMSAYLRAHWAVALRLRGCQRCLSVLGNWTALETPARGPGLPVTFRLIVTALLWTWISLSENEVVEVDIMGNGFLVSHCMNLVKEKRKALCSTTYSRNIPRIFCPALRRREVAGQQHPACVWADRPCWEWLRGLPPTALLFLPCCLGRLFGLRLAKPQFPWLPSGDNNNSMWLLRLLWRLNTILYLKCLVFCLAGGRQRTLTVIIKCIKY